MTPSQHLARAILAARALPPAPPPAPVIIVPRPVQVTAPTSPPAPARAPRPSRRRRRAKAARRSLRRRWRAPCVVEIDPSLPALRRIVAAAHGFTVDAMCHPRRTADLVEARAEFCYRAALRPDATSVAIGNAIGRVHGTVRHAIGRHCEQHGLSMSCGKVDLSEERRRRIERGKAAHRRRLADRMTQEDGR